jgi:RNA-splicing ligase RtcB
MRHRSRFSTEPVGAPAFDPARAPPERAHSNSLDTIDGGNHSGELQMVERITASDTRGITPDSVCRYVHSASRGVGEAILRASECRWSSGQLTCGTIVCIFHGRTAECQRYRSTPADQASSNQESQIHQTPHRSSLCLF